MESKVIFLSNVLSELYLIKFNFLNKVINSNNSNIEYDLIIPISLKDMKVFFKNKEFYKKYLKYSNIVLIGQSNISELIFNDSSISFIREDFLIRKEEINNYLFKMRSITTDRDGWYEQQFLKMAYSRICKKEYYLVWDSDTIPIKYINMFENGHPYFDMKTEHHIPYFETIKRLIPGLNFSNKSYISEHMIIKTQLMKNLIDNIEMNSKIPGNIFWEKILMSIDDKDIYFSGFSEFETYGSYVDTKFPNVYYHRDWYSNRDTKIFYDNVEYLSEKDILWLSQDYQALSFEKYQKFEKQNYKIIKNYELQKLYKPIFFFMNYENILKKYKQFNLTK